MISCGSTRALGIPHSLPTGAQLLGVHVQPNGLHQVVAVTCLPLRQQRLLELPVAVAVAVDDVPIPG